MARPKKTGLDYFPFDVQFFSNKKIKILKARYGTDGVVLFLFLLCEIYKNGYYLIWDDDYKYVVADELNLSDGLIEQVLNFLIERSLLNRILLGSDTFLTSPGIQSRFQEAVKSRAVKSPVSVISELWLLSKEKTQGFIKFTQNSDIPQNNYDFSKNNPSNSEKNATKKSKVNESKVNESKVNKIKVCYRVPAINGDFELTQDFYDELTKTYSETDIDESLKKMINFLKANPAKKRYVGNTKAYIELWIGTDSRRGINPRRQSESEATYDIDLYESMSLDRLDEGLL